MNKIPKKPSKLPYSPIPEKDTIYKITDIHTEPLGKYKKCVNCGEDIFFQKKWNKWYHNNGKKNCSDEYGLPSSLTAHPSENELIVETEQTKFNLMSGEGVCNKCHKELRWGKENRPYGWITFTDYSGESYDGKEFLFCEKCA